MVDNQLDDNRLDDRLRSKERAHHAASIVLSQYLRATAGQRLWCFTDNGRLWLAEALATGAAGLGLAATVVNLECSGETPESVQSSLATLSPSDIVISVMSLGPVSSRYFRVFPSFRPPEGFPGRSAVIRQHYPDETLLAHLTTAPATAEAAATRALAYDGLRRVRITAPSGTDICCELKPAQVLPYRIGDGRHVYLPPAEVAYGIVPGSANGVIVCDITVGEFVVRGEVYDALGLVDAPVRIAVAAGRVTGVSGGDIATRFAACLARIDREQPAGSDGRAVVELGFGLSESTPPIGFSAADECLQGTCHFGIGNDFFFGGKNAVPMHMDVILRGPAKVVGR